MKEWLKDAFAFHWCGYKMKNPIFTKYFFASLAGGLVGFIITSSPLFWSAMQNDLSPMKGEKHMVAIMWGMFEFEYASLVRLSGETLLAAVALGVAASVNWFESRLDGKPLGRLAAGYAGAALVGSILALVLYTGIARAGIAPDLYNEDFVKYVKSAYILFLGLVVFYFSSILQVRRVKDLGVLADG